VINVPNWETYTEGWWYETRLVNATCPVEPVGIAATVDWALMPLCLFGNPESVPRTVYVHTLMLPHFAESTLRFMRKTDRFVLVSSAVDITIPMGTGDIRPFYKHRIRGFGGDGGGANWRAIVGDSRVLHWFAENRDIVHPKMSTLPTGYSMEMLAGENQTYISPDYENKENIKLPLPQRPLTVLTADRLRDRSGQWAARYNVEQMCLNVTWCHVPLAETIAFNGIPHAAFLKELHLASFVSCAHGGGLDPSPKAFEAIHEGTIPIIERTVIYDAYQHLPVMWIDSWGQFFQQPEAQVVALLQRWRDQLAPYYEPSSALRHATIKKLQTSYWSELINKKYEELIKPGQGENKGKGKDEGKGTDRGTKHVRVRVDETAKPSA